MKKRLGHQSAIAKLDVPAAQQQRLTDLAKHASSTEVTTAVLIGPKAGKANAAEALASELGRPLIRIDLSAVVGKYIGETEKNLSRVFDEAEAAGAVLFFDEADALFGQRTEINDSHDHYANQEVDYLLVRIQERPGLTLLASNMKSGQEASRARFDHVIDLEPDESTH